ncbi:hypothetical protein CROQUDRAFT_52999 [Cronartium quercuum f. sp. fusiforme G11]|uniref:Acyl-CoA thioesterase-like N-terminal HotDog domain-containing protein n=1 Tax=Cronartium quercuum f. sp. fusiforme G11 TaxID=708437 RepID=A0A9P6T7M1_9BASI|nr:hypothetical protein CROQUDRAFT_52999 [Cronartium quercuum f. sp. fusiforme G11]
MAPIGSSLSSLRLVERRSNLSYTYRGEVDHEWTGASAPLGGYIIAMMLSAAILSQAEPSSGAQKPITPAHITAHFLSRSSIGPIDFHIQILRIGKTWSTVEVKSIQKDRNNVIAQVLFRKTMPTLPPHNESPAEKQSAIKPMTSRSGYSILCPMITHPKLAAPSPFTRVFNFRSHVRWNEDLAIIHRQPMTQDATEPIHWAAWHEFLDESADVFNQPALLCYLCDMFKNFTQLLPSDDDEEATSHGNQLWFPTLVFSVRFLAPPTVTEQQNFSRRRTGLHLTSKFNEPNGVHDDVLEVWTCPNEDQSPNDFGWRHKQRCLAVGTQLATTVPSRRATFVAKL